MKYEETTDFWIDWGNEQNLTVQDGLATATQVLRAGPRPLQLSTRSTTYFALGENIPPLWLALFEHAHDSASVQADLRFVARGDLGFITQAIALSPCEQGEHLHASVSLEYMVVVGEDAPIDEIEAALYETWRDVGERMSELQEQWVMPFLDEALDLNSLHGGI